MNHWQDLVVLGLIGSAGIYLAYLLWRRLTKRGPCDACTCCPASPKEKDSQDNPQRLTIQVPNAKHE